MRGREKKNNCGDNNEKRMVWKVCRCFVVVAQHSTRSTIVDYECYTKQQAKQK